MTLYPDFCKVTENAFKYRLLIEDNDSFFFFKHLYVIISYMKRANDAAVLGSKIAAKM